jgi:hypothetical protein
MRLNYAEGTVFAIPLRSGGFAVGLVARAAPRGRLLLVYLFGPRRESVPELAEVANVHASSAIRIVRAGDLHLIEGKWPVIGQLGEFRREDWPFPKFVRTEELARRAWVVEYADDHPGHVVAETPVAFGASKLDCDSSFGAGAVELLLTKLLGGSDMKSGGRVAGDAPLAPGNQRAGRMFWHYIYVPDRAKADALGAKLKREGFAVQITMGADDVNWLVRARHELIPNEQERVEKQLTKAAKAVGGEYDGWEAEA